jgi:hypothetical protein
MAKPSRPPEICPVCGEDVPRNAKACPECGADEQSGWKEDALEIDAVGGDADEFDYDRFVQEEFGGKVSKPAIGWFWWAVAAVLLIWILVGFVL